MKFALDFLTRTLHLPSPPFTRGSNILIMPFPPSRNRYIISRLLPASLFSFSRERKLDLSENIPTLTQPLLTFSSLSLSSGISSFFLESYPNLRLARENYFCGSKKEIWWKKETVSRERLKRGRSRRGRIPAGKKNRRGECEASFRPNLQRSYLNYSEKLISFFLPLRENPLNVFPRLTWTSRSRRISE